MKGPMLWDITPYTPVKVHRHFGETYCPHVQGRKVSEARNQQQGDGKQVFSCSSILNMEAIRSSET
jgi:hypothetical protein